MNKKMLIPAGYIIFGITLIFFGILEVIDSFWSGLGGGLIGAGAAQLYKHIRYNKDEAYREAADTAKTDERNHFLANKAMSWAAYLFMIISSLGTIVARFAGYRELSAFLGFAVCFLMVLYWLCYLYLKKKY